MHKRFSPKILITQIANYCKDLCSLNYGSAPDFTINGDLDATFPYVPVHVDYIMMELLKNSFRATVEHSGKINRHNHPKVEITIAKDIDNVSIRVRDGGGGIPSKDLPFVFDYSFTTVPKIDNDVHFSNMSKMSMVNSSGGVMAGLGFGLPMSRVYASYFGGSLELQTIAGYGCDLFVNLPAISDASI